MALLASQGDISCRLLHSIPSMAFEGLAHWVSNVLGTQVASYQHFVRDSKHFKSQIEGLRVKPGMRMVTLDPKDFISQAEWMLLL